MSPLRRRMTEDMQIRNLTPSTQRIYAEQVARFARHFGKSPDPLGLPQIRARCPHCGSGTMLAISCVVPPAVGLIAPDTS